MAIDCDAYGFFNKVLPMNQTNWANHFKGLLPDCVVAGIGDECLVYAGTEGLGMKVRVLTGQAMISNHRAFINSAKELPISEADDEFDRIDTVVLRVLYGDVVDGAGTSKIELDILEGDPAGIPEPADLTQVTGGTYEMPLAYVRVQAGTETVLPDDVTDARYIYDGSDRVGLDFINGEEDPLTTGELVKMTNMDNTVKRADEFYNNTIGVVTAGAPPRGHVKVQCTQGKLVNIKCSSSKVNPGDALMVDTANPGMAIRGGGWGVIGIAVQGKEENIIGNVRSLLTAYSYFPLQSTWYLPTGVTEDQVIAAYQFVFTNDELTALVNINTGTSYPLTKSAGNITWNPATGFFFPPGENSGLDNGALEAVGNSAVTIAARFAGAYNADNVAIGLYCIGGTRCGNAKGYYNSYQKTPTISFGSGKSWDHNKTDFNSGVLSADFIDGAPMMYLDGASVSVALHTNAFWQANSGYSTIGRNLPNGYNLNNLGSVYIQAVAIYSTQLTAEQHLELATAMNAL